MLVAGETLCSIGISGEFTFVVHTKMDLDFDNDSYVQNSETIKTIRILKKFFKIPIENFFEKIDPISSLIDATMCQRSKRLYFHPQTTLKLFLGQLINI